MNISSFEYKRPLSISSEDVHLWYVLDEELVDEAVLSSYFELMNEAELAQEKRFHFPKHRHQYLITRSLVRSVLSLYDNNIKPHEWVFGKNDYGKPFIENKNLSLPLSFNISHTEKIVILAVTLNNEIGVDVEYLNRGSYSLSLAKNVFSAAEYENLCNLPIEARKERFFDLWTLKEAYIKACGMGLSIPLDQFSYSFLNDRRILITFDPCRNDDPKYWQFWCLQINNIHKISLSVNNQLFNPKHVISLRKVIPLASVEQSNFSIIKQAL